MKGERLRSSGSSDQQHYVVVEEHGDYLIAGWKERGQIWAHDLYQFNSHESSSSVTTPDGRRFGYISTTTHTVEYLRRYILDLGGKLHDAPTEAIHFL